jgi:hypothetical protein
MIYGDRTKEHRNQHGRDGKVNKNMGKPEKGYHENVKTSCKSW